MLWDLHRRLSGQIILTGNRLQFEFHDFSKSHLQLHIQLKEIEKAEEMSVYRFAKHGLKIISKSGREDIFVLEDPHQLKLEIQKRSLR